MENPFEMIFDKLTIIENLLRQKQYYNPVEQPIVNLVTEIMNLNQAASYLSISKSTMYKYTSAREIPHAKTGKRIYFKKVELDGWLTKHKIMSRDEIEQEANNYITKQKKKW